MQTSHHSNYSPHFFFVGSFSSSYYRYSFSNHSPHFLAVLLSVIPHYTVIISPTFLSPIFFNLSSSQSNINLLLLPLHLSLPLSSCCACKKKVITLSIFVFPIFFFFCFFWWISLNFFLCF